MLRKQSAEIINEVIMNATPEELDYILRKSSSALVPLALGVGGAIGGGVQGGIGGAIGGALGKRADGSGAKGFDGILPGAWAGAKRGAGIGGVSGLLGGVGLVATGSPLVTAAAMNAGGLLALLAGGRAGYKQKLPVGGAE